MDGNTDARDDPSTRPPLDENPAIEAASERVVASRRAEFLVELFEDLEEPVTIDELADRVLARQHRRSDGTDIENWADAHDQLHSVVLPALHRTGEIDFDASTGLVTPLGGRTDEPANTSEEEGRKSNVRILGLLAISVVLVGLTGVGAWPLTNASTLSLAAGNVVLVAILALLRIVGKF